MPKKYRFSLPRVPRYCMCWNCSVQKVYLGMYGKCLKTCAHRITGYVLIVEIETIQGNVWKMYLKTFKIVVRDMCWYSTIPRIVCSRGYAWKVFQDLHWNYHAYIGNMYKISINNTNCSRIFVENIPECVLKLSQRICRKCSKTVQSVPGYVWKVS
jgi:hypothetical protein